MNVIKVKDVHIDAVYGCVPENIVDNEKELKELFGEKEARNIVKGTGIYKRAIADSGVSSIDLCVSCAEKMLEDKVFKPEEIGTVVFVTFTPERLLPFNAAKVQDMLGLGNDIASFDVNLACSGYPYGLWISSTLAGQTGRKVLLLDGDVQSAFLSGKDKATVPVLADGGSATLISAGKAGREWSFSFYTDGGGREFLTIPSGGSKSPVTKEALVMKAYNDGSSRRDRDIFMDGFEIFKFVAQPVSKFLDEFILRTADGPGGIDYFVPHQANMYMIKQLGRKLKIPWDKTWQSGDRVGNSASATVPVTIAMNGGKQLEKEESRVLVSGFGGGLSASAGMITLDKGASYKFFTYKSRNYEEE